MVFLKEEIRERTRDLKRKEEEARTLKIDKHLSLGVEI